MIFISHVTTSETKVKLFRPLMKSEIISKNISATLNLLQNIRELE